MRDPKTIADNILAIIDSDVSRIQTEFTDIRLDVDTALTLTRYLKSVYDAKDSQEDELEKHTDRLSKMSNKELKAMALEILQKKSLEDGT